MRYLMTFSALALLAATGVSAFGEDAGKPYPETPEFKAAVASSWTNLTPEWQSRLAADPVQALCNLYRNRPPADVAAAIVAEAKAGIALPAGDQLIGDWKRGQVLANNGRGGQFSDDPKQPNGGNCYACHQLDPAEVSYGTLGPSLTGYGKLHGATPEAARAAYAKIYNAQSAVACSNMPRFGANHVLTPEQIKDAVALLLDPASPVNK